MEENSNPFKWSNNTTISHSDASVGTEERIVVESAESAHTSVDKIPPVSSLNDTIVIVRSHDIAHEIIGRATGEANRRSMSKWR
jgi:hypothetical protein